jgi:hypothetical protein
LVSRLVVLVLLMGAPAGIVQRSAPAALGAAPQILDAYERGDYDGAVAAMPTVGGLEGFGRRLAQEAPRWISAAGPDAVARRRMIVATVALEAARPAMERKVWPDIDSADPVGARLIEWGCGFLREAPPHPAERWWHLASLALGQYSYDQLFLIGVPENLKHALDFPGQVSFAVRAHGRALNHLNHARGRFPDEPRIKLIDVAAREVMGDVGSWSWLSRHQNDLVDGWVRGHPDLLQRLGWSYAELTSVPSIRGEAHLRAGVVEFRFGRFDAALKHLDRVEAFSTEPFLVYLSRFFRAKSYERQRQVARAEMAYRSALEVVPNAGSSATALATLLFLSDRREEANALVEAALAARPQPADPWREYWAGDHRLWADHIRRVREALR